MNQILMYMSLLNQIVPSYFTFGEEIILNVFIIFNNKTLNKRLWPCLRTKLNGIRNRCKI